MKRFIYMAAISALIIAALSACVEMPDPGGNMPSGGKIPASAAFVATTDYSLTGGYGVIDLNDFSVYAPDPSRAADVASPNPTAVAYNDYLFVLNRFSYDNVTVLNKQMSVINQYSVSDASCSPSNPYDLAFVDLNKAYLSRYECRDIWIINPLTGQRLGSIDLVGAGFGGADGIPEMSGLLLHGNTLYVAVQLLDRNNWWAPEAKGRLVMINTVTDAVVGSVELTGMNPYTDVFYSAPLDKIVVGEVGTWSMDGGVDKVNPATGTAEGWMVTEATLGGSISDVDILSATRGYAAVNDFSFQSHLVAFNPLTGTRDAADVFAAGGYDLVDLAIDASGKLFLCDRTATSPGVRIFDTAAGDAQFSLVPLNVGLPPISIALMP